jgi:hypothetical protein
MRSELSKFNQFPEAPPPNATLETKPLTREPSGDPSYPDHGSPSRPPSLTRLLSIGFDALVDMKDFDWRLSGRGGQLKDPDWQDPSLPRPFLPTKRSGRWRWVAGVPYQPLAEGELPGKSCTETAPRTQCKMDTQGPLFKITKSNLVAHGRDPSTQGPAWLHSKFKTNLSYIAITCLKKQDQRFFFFNA